MGSNHLGGLPRWLSGKESACHAGDPGSTPELGRSLEEETATHSSILAWRIQWTEEPGGLQSMRSQRVGHDCVTKHAHSPVGEHTLSGPTSALFFHRVPGDLRFGDGGGYGPHWASLMTQQWKKIIHLPCRICRRHSFHPWFGKIPWRRKWQPTPVFLPGKSHGQSSLVAYCPGGCKESHTAEHMCTHAQLCPILCKPTDCSMLGFPVLHCLPEFVQTRVH